MPRVVRFSEWSFPPYYSRDFLSLVLESVTLMGGWELYRV